MSDVKFQEDPKPACYGTHATLGREHIRRDCRNCHVVTACVAETYAEGPAPADDHKEQAMDRIKSLLSPRAVITFDDLQRAGVFALDEDTKTASDRQVAGSHYKEMGVEPWDVIDTWPLEQRIGAYRAGALKYTMRMGSKDERLQEIEKGGHYLEKLIEVLQEAPTAPDVLVAGSSPLVAEIERLQAQVDALMLEYCPSEMTPEQVQRFVRHQVACSS